MTMRSRIPERETMTRSGALLSQVLRETLCRYVFTWVLRVAICESTSILIRAQSLPSSFLLGKLLLMAAMEDERKIKYNAPDSQRLRDVPIYLFALPMQLSRKISEID